MRKPEKQDQNWEERFRRCGHKLTVPRRVILEHLMTTADHPSADEVYLGVHRKYPAIGLATVYRTLELLVQMGLAFKFDFGDCKARYELVHEISGDHHHHLVCKSCRRIINYYEFIDDEITLLKKTEKGLAKKYDFEISDHLIQFYGTCDRCR